LYHVEGHDLELLKGGGGALQRLGGLTLAGVGITVALER